MHPTLLKGVDSLGFAHPTPIQTEAIPHALEGRASASVSPARRGSLRALLLRALVGAAARQPGRALRVLRAGLQPLQLVVLLLSSPVCLHSLELFSHFYPLLVLELLLFLL